VLCRYCDVDVIVRDRLAGGTGAGPSGDGQLDCDEGEIAQGADSEVFADTEDGVVALALEQWTAKGAVAVELPPDESWSAVLDDRDVAIAYPERNGDGGWIVHAVSTCGPSLTGPAGFDGELDCANDSSWSQQGSIDPTIPGLPTVELALRDAIQPHLERHRGTFARIREAVGSLVMEDREQVVALASEVDAGGWVVTTLKGCRGFEP
jgi:hypothetical protein